MARRIGLRIIFARNVRALRGEQGLSQEALAALTGVHRTYLSSIERGKRNVSIDNIERIARALNTPPSELLSKRARN